MRVILTFDYENNKTLINDKFKSSLYFKLTLHDKLIWNYKYRISKENQEDIGENLSKILDSILPEDVSILYKINDKEVNFERKKINQL